MLGCGAVGKRSEGSGHAQGPGDGVATAALARPDPRIVDTFSVVLVARGCKDGQPLSRYSVHAYARAIRGFLTWFSKEGEQVAARPARVLDVPSSEELATPEGGAPTERDRIIIRLLVDHDLRATELCQLQVGDVVRHDRQAFLRVEGEHECLLPLPPLLLRRIEQYARPFESPHSELFLSLRLGRSGEHEPLTRSGLTELIDHAAERAGLDPNRIYPHLLRHSFVTNALRAGINPLLLSQIAGHSSMRMVEQVYGHLNAGDG